MSTSKHDADLNGFSFEPAATLRLVGGAMDEHRATWTISGVRFLEQVWTDEEWAALSEPERPASAQRLPGIGWTWLRRETD